METVAGNQAGANEEMAVGEQAGGLAVPIVEIAMGKQVGELAGAIWLTAAGEQLFWGVGGHQNEAFGRQEAEAGSPVMASSPNGLASGLITRASQLSCPTSQTELLHQNEAEFADADYPPAFNCCSPLGEFAFNIIATDADDDPLSYSLTGENSFYFTVNRTTGNVTIRSLMDREQTDTFFVTVGVSDGVYHEVSKEVRIILDDANDNRPMFDPPSYDIHIPENTTEDTVLCQVTANDPDDGLAKIVIYKIDNVVPSDGIDLFSISNRNGEVKLAGSLNYTSKSSFYQLKINASDCGGLYHGKNIIQSSTAFASITVTDVPDLDPQFINVPYAVTVTENTPIGHSVFKVRAIDPDKGVNASMLYSIQSSNRPGLFEINESTGDISVKKLFDREELLDIDATVMLTLMASETTENVHGTFSSTVTNMKITIGDINDNKPKFYYCTVKLCLLNTEATSFSGDINEHSSVGVSVTGLNIFARDLDQGPQLSRIWHDTQEIGPNATFSLHLEGQDKDAFYVSPSSATSEAQVQIHVNNPQDVDYEEKKIMIVEVVATDISCMDCCSTATVTIQINDINDNTPTFQHETYDIEVKEHIPKGTVIATITAADPDTADINYITYRLLPDSILKYFNVSPRTGTIKVVDGQLIDREVSSSFYATLQATDSNKHVGRTNLEISLLDINDMTPNIPRESYVEFVKEGPGQSLSLQIHATDADQTATNNSKIQYRIESSEFSDNFTIDIDTGVLQNKDQLDREAINPLLNGAIVLNVTATDMGEQPRGTSVKVTVNVEDINDSTPLIKERKNEFFVKEREKGSFVGSVFADDADQTEINNRISFRINDGSFGNFIIISSAEDTGGFIGNMSVDPDVELDYERGQRLYTLTIEATDLGQRKDTVKVKVNVLDVNDERPTLPKDLTWHVAENTTGLGVVGKIAGGDLDSNHSLVYELISTRCYCNATMGPCDEEWFVVEPTGAVMVNEEFQVDYEKCTQVLLEVQVVDIFTEKGENTSLPGKLAISIDDLNDNIPIFMIPDGLFVVLTESTEQGMIAASVSAFDQDSGKNKVIQFSVLSVEFIDTNNVQRPMDKIFSAETTAEQNHYKGNIRCLGSLDSNLKGKYLITIEAKDTGNLGATTQIEIYTIDRSYRVGLRFESSVAEINTNLNHIKGALSATTKSFVQILEVAAESTDQRTSEMTVLGVYFIYPNGSAISSDTVEGILQEDLYHANILRKYGLAYIVSGGIEVKEIDPVFLVLIGLVAGLGIILAIMITSLVCTQKTYRRKLKAAKAMNTAAMMKTESHKSRAVLPGTNKYTMEGANPVLNLKIDEATDLSFDEEGCCADRLGLDSLGYNADLNLTEKDIMPMMVIEEEDEENGSDILPDNKNTEPLEATLAQQDKNKASNIGESYDNPAFCTTDL
ncbi:cadherin-related family member 2-like [Paramormyrops kingsleyae]|uniref:cadherin-related family member 2-like n=1 Tax=Paramormyrops kingsleyae TaxID=1676925 RepID=UPI003B973E11